MASNDSDPRGQGPDLVEQTADLIEDSSRRHPVIGLTTYLEQAKQGVWDVRAAFLPQVYFDAVTASGGIAVLLPPQHHSATGLSADVAAGAVLDGLDGLNLTGGLDVQPELYGAERHPRTDPPRPDRDAWEMALFHGADERRMPVLAICRGLQLVNVARGGTLHQHLPEALGTERFRVGGGVFAPNTVAIDEGTVLAGIIGERELEVHSYHHQGVDRLGDGLVSTARTDDGLVQAIESTGDGYLVGVQWHPEQDIEDRRLFAGLVRAASDYATKRGGPSRIGESRRHAGAMS